MDALLSDKHLEDREGEDDAKQNDGCSSSPSHPVGTTEALLNDVVDDRSCAAQWPAATAKENVDFGKDLERSDKRHDEYKEYLWR